MQRIIEGVRKFQTEVFPSESKRFEQLANSQSPKALFITCSDSRIVPNLITQVKPGELFIIRNAGNIVPAYTEMVDGVSATIEYAVAALEVHDIIVCGHSDCGAMKAVKSESPPRELPRVAAWLHYADRARVVVDVNYQPASEAERLELLTQENVLAQVDHLMTHPSVAARVKKGVLRLHGWVYEIESGKVAAYHPEQLRFRDLSEVYEASGELRKEKAS